MSDGAISQDEIDALLSGVDMGGLSAGGTSSVAPTAHIDIDTLSKFANGLTGKLADNLKTMTGKEVSVGTPVVESVNRDQLLAKLPEVVVAVMLGRWFQKLFLGGLVASFKSINAFSIVNHQQQLLTFMLGGLTTLFKDALVISLPIMGTLFLINLAMGVLTKAAPQMNLMSEGFSIMMLMAFFIITVLMPVLCDYFLDSFSDGFRQLEVLFTQLSKGTS